MTDKGKMERPGKYLLTLLLLWSCATEAAVTASVDRTRIAESDSLELTIRATAGEEVNDADLSPLKHDFDVVSSATSSRLSIINGKRERSSDLKVVLLPRRAGKLRIPPLTVGKARTREILIEVTKTPQGLDNARDVFVEVEVDRESVYVQSQIVHTFRVYEAIDLVDRGRSQLEIADAVVEELDSAQFQRNIDGRAYRVIEVRHAIFPQKSGELTIPSMSFNGARLLPRRSFFDRNVETLRRRSRSITVEVKPIPASFPDAPWIPAANLELEESWSALPEELQIGDSVTRTITLVAEGIDGSQLPPLEVDPIEGVKVYPDQPRSENTRGPDGITGIGINSTALLLTEPGEFELPAIRVPWWDTNQNRVRYAEIPAQRLSIKPPVLPESATGVTTPAPAIPATPAATVEAAPISIWMWTTLAALLGWLGTTSWLLWRMQPRQAEPDTSEKSQSEARCFRALTRACEENRGSDARAALCRWAQIHFEDPAPPTLQELRRRFSDAGIDNALDELERSLFSATPADWSGSRLISALGAWRKGQKGNNRAAAAPLPPLYPPTEAGHTGSTSGGLEARV